MQSLCYPTTTCYEKPALQCWEPKQFCADDCNSLSLSKLQLDEPEYGCGCGCQKKWGAVKSYAPSCGCKGEDRSNRGSYNAGCFENRGCEDHAWDTRGRYSAQNRCKEDRSNRACYGSGSVWRGQDKCLNFENNCAKPCYKSTICACGKPFAECSCIKRDICNACQRPALKCACIQKRRNICSCGRPAAQCTCF